MKNSRQPARHAARKIAKPHKTATQQQIAEAAKAWAEFLYTEYSSEKALQKP